MTPRPCTWPDGGCGVLDSHPLRRESCRQCRDETQDLYRAEEHVIRPAEFILWGKLFPAEALGPRCYDHAAEWVDMARVEQWAVYDLRPVNAAMAERERAAGQATKAGDG